MLGVYNPNILMLTRDTANGNALQFSQLAQYPNVTSDDSTVTINVSAPDATTGQTTYDLSVSVGSGGGNPVTSFALNDTNSMLEIGTTSGATFGILLSDLATALGVGAPSAFTATLAASPNNVSIGMHSNGSGTNVDVRAPLASLNIDSGGNIIFNDGVNGNMTVGTVGGSGVTVTSFQINGANLELTLSDSTVFSVPTSSFGGSSGATSSLTNTITGHQIGVHADGAGNTVILNETITSIVSDGAGGITFTNEAGTNQTILAGQLGANETTTTLVPDGNGGFTYTNEDGTATTVESCYIPAKYEAAIPASPNAIVAPNLEFQNESAALEHGKISCGRPLMNSDGTAMTFEVAGVASSNYPLVRNDGSIPPEDSIQQDVVVCAMYINPAQATTANPPAVHDAAFQGWILQDYISPFQLDGNGNLIGGVGTLVYTLDDGVPHSVVAPNAVSGWLTLHTETIPVQSGVNTATLCYSRDSDCGSCNITTTAKGGTTNNRKTIECRTLVNGSVINRADLGAVTGLVATAPITVEYQYRVTQYVVGNGSCNNAGPTLSQSVYKLFKES